MECLKFYTTLGLGMAMVLQMSYWDTGDSVRDSKKQVPLLQRRDQGS